MRVGKKPNDVRRPRTVAQYNKPSFPFWLCSFVGVHVLLISLNTFLSILLWMFHDAVAPVNTPRSCRYHRTPDSVSVSAKSLQHFHLKQEIRSLINESAHLIKSDLMALSITLQLISLTSVQCSITAAKSHRINWKIRNRSRVKSTGSKWVVVVDR